MRLSIFWSASTANCGNHITNLLDSLPSKPECILIGMHTGLSIQIEAWSEANDVPIERYLPQYDVNGDQSIKMRNQRLIENATILLVIWDGRDYKCKALIDMASEAGLKCLQLNPLSEHAHKPTKNLAKKISVKEIKILKDEALKIDPKKQFPITAETVLLLVDAIERRDFVLKKLSDKDGKEKVSAAVKK